MIFPAFLNALFFYNQDHLRVWLTIGWIALYMVLYVIYLPLRYRNLSFSLTDTYIVLHSGVIYHRVRSIPLQNIQYTTLYRNPFDRLFGLCSLVVTAAGGRITLPGLRLSDAQRLSAVLRRDSGG